MTTSEASKNRVSSDEQREHMMVQAAKLYYDLDRNQSEVAKELGLTRWQVGRLLREARELDIVRIEIVPRSPRIPQLEASLQKVYGLREAVIVPASTKDESIVRDSIAQAAAQLISMIFPKPHLLGVSWGRTMSAVARWIPVNWNQNVQVVLLNGSTSRNNSPSRTNNVAEKIAVSGNGMAILLPVPAILGRKSTRVALENDPPIADVLHLAHEAPVACFSLGSLSSHSVLVESGYLTPSDIEHLEMRGAVGDILGRFVDAEGNIVDTELDDRTLGLPLENLKDKSFSMGVAGGRSKHEVVLACLRMNFINVLVSDEHTANFLLESSS